MPAHRKYDSQEDFSAEDILHSGVETESGTSTATSGWGDSKFIRAQLDVNAVTGSNGTLDVTLEDSVDGTNWNTIATFTQADDETQEVKNVAEPFADRVRAKWVIAGDAATNASLTTSLTGTNNDLVFTAVSGVAAEGNAITVAYIDPSANDQELGIVVTDSDIVINLATGGAGAITTIADDISAAILADEDASALVTVADAAANDGSGVVTEMAEDALEGGVDGTSFDFSLVAYTELDI